MWLHSRSEPDPTTARGATLKEEAEASKQKIISNKRSPNLRLVDVDHCYLTSDEIRTDE